MQMQQEFLQTIKTDFLNNLTRYDHEAKQLLLGKRILLNLLACVFFLPFHTRNILHRSCVLDYVDCTYTVF